MFGVAVDPVLSIQKILEWARDAAGKVKERFSGGNTAGMPLVVLGRQRNYQRARQAGAVIRINFGMEL